ncbi:MAG: LacI family DNA-binding transcriptional regulator [Eubacteriales bacterium]|nr:LacI family DNA-binding transcriptional regulator [Eubacteriales bacterium]MDD4326789.1 LacI family DNA-binding transcriptional regulator [Eubacteriales bacterium]MDD4716934.1 LacI family DNA-binding transcriptional regulator [Eubacteriales bacterium]
MKEKGKKITIYDVAKAAGCSTATVSLVLHNDKRIKEETRNKVRECIKTLNYKPSYLARSLAIQRTQSIGIIVPEMTNPVFSELVHGAEGYLSQNGYNVIIGSTNQDLDKEKLYLDMLSGKKVDGLIILPTFLSEIEDKLKDMQAMHFPFVVTGVKSSMKNVNYVSTNKVEGAFIGVEHLIHRGHKNIAFVRGSEVEEHSSERLEGYIKALNVYGIPFREDYIIKSRQDFSDVREKVRGFKKEHPEVTALFCLYDFIAMAVMKALYDLKLSIPKDVAVVGYDNIQLGEYLPVGLTSIDGNNYKVGEIAARILVNQITSDAEEIQHIILTPKLVIREST